ncbi:MAG: dihydroorotase [Clostridia bacterium]|nr:dihydroorotase [Clostridia bacterium]
MVSDMYVKNGTIAGVSPILSPLADTTVYNFDNAYLFPGLIDVHVHLREPGFSYKETVLSGTNAALHGGFTSVCPMPNLNPVPDCDETLKLQEEIIKRDAKVNVYPFGSITYGEKGEKLSDMNAMAGRVVGFSDDGRGVQSAEMMENAMKKAKSLGKIISAHCEDNSLLHGGVIHDGEFAKLSGIPGICSESEWKPIERDIALAAKTGCKYHVCHISTKESVALIREAKKNGVDITCETAPHYLVFDDGDIENHGRFKMNPPIRSRADKEALIEGVCDGTIDMIATDHAPHTVEEKSKGLIGSPFGVVGLETSFAACYTYLVKTGLISLQKLMALMHDNAMKRFGIGNSLEIGDKADFTVFDLSGEFTVNPEEFLTLGRSTPFEGKKLCGVCKMTAVSGDIRYGGNFNA